DSDRPLPRWNDLLRAVREARGLTQAGWGALLGAGRTTIQRWERGEAVPDPPLLGSGAVPPVHQRAAGRKDAHARRAAAVTGRGPAGCGRPWLAPRRPHRTSGRRAATGGGAADGRRERGAASPAPAAGAHPLCRPR